MSFTCCQPSKDGGESYVVSVVAIYEHIKKVLHPSEMDALFRTNAVRFKRGMESATEAVLRRDEETRHIYMCQRRDILVDKIEEAAHPDARAGVLAMFSFINDPRNHVVYKLQRNETLLYNNAAVLHARRSFPNGQIQRLDRLNFHTVGSGAKLDDGRTRVSRLRGTLGRSSNKVDDK